MLVNVAAAAAAPWGALPPDDDSGSAAGSAQPRLGTAQARAAAVGGSVPVPPRSALQALVDSAAAPARRGAGQ